MAARSRSLGGTTWHTNQTNAIANRMNSIMTPVALLLADLNSVFLACRYVHCESYNAFHPTPSLYTSGPPPATNYPQGGDLSGDLYGKQKSPIPGAKERKTRPEPDLIKRVQLGCSTPIWARFRWLRAVHFVPLQIGP